MVEAGWPFPLPLSSGCFYGCFLVIEAQGGPFPTSLPTAPAAARWPHTVR